MAIVLAGATASGKSAVAMALARLTGGEIVCADAFQLYAGLPILTARPSAAETAECPHRLYGSVPLNEDLDAARYARMAAAELEILAAQGRPAIITGGSGLYIKSLTHGLSALPADPGLRAEIAAMEAAAAVDRLLTLDPAAAAAVNLRNPRYVQRALEIVILTGRPLAETKTSFAAGPRPGIRGILLHRDREELYDRISRRTLAMMDEGVLEEVRTVSGFPLSATAQKTLGLRELQDCLAGRITAGEAVAAIQQATRHYAKRQGTWFRRETWMEALSVSGRNPEETAAAILTTGACA